MQVCMRFRQHHRPGEVSSITVFFVWYIYYTITLKALTSLFTYLVIQFIGSRWPGGVCYTGLRTEKFSLFVVRWKEKKLSWVWKSLNWMAGLRSSQVATGDWDWSWHALWLRWGLM